jgi:hypothetical protein
MTTQTWLRGWFSREVLTLAWPAYVVLFLALAWLAFADTGVVWQTGATLTDQSTPYAGLVLSDSQVFLFNRDSADGALKTLRVFQSVDFGATFQQTVSVATGLANAIPSPDSAVYLPASGQFLLAGGTTLGAGSAFLRGSSYSWSFPTVTGGPAGTITAHSLKAQGSTILGVIDPGAAGNAYICRSTNQGATFACAQPGIGPMRPLLTSAAAPGTFQALASPGVNVWVALDDNAVIWRSFDDGQTWSQIVDLNNDTNPLHAVVCVTSSICVAMTSSSASAQIRMYRSTDTGINWTQTFTAPRTDRVTNLINFSQGVITALADPTAGAPAPYGYRTPNFGVTWTPVPATALSAPVSASTFVAYLDQWVQSTGGGAVPALFATGGGTLGVLVMRSIIQAVDPANASGLGTFQNPVRIITRGATVATPLSDITVTGSATLVRAANAGRVGLTCTNNHIGLNARLGDPTITASKGVRLGPGSSVTIQGVYAVYAISEGGSLTLSCTEDQQ